MFTGIIEAIGTISAVQPKSGDLVLTIRTGELDLSDVRLGDSIAVNGVCLTVTELQVNGFRADVSRETMAHTRVDQLTVGETVNLEKALTLSTRLGGHLVSGHVDGLGTIVRRYDDARSVRLEIKPPAALAKYIAEKGSITVDGVSLTVNGFVGDHFLLNIVPHTARQTIIQHYSAGRQVHLEVDLLARYLERLMLKESSDDLSQSSGLTAAMVLQAGIGRRR